MDVSAALNDLELGESIAVNGCCLTVVCWNADSVRFELSPETINRTSFEKMRAGDKVNLERAMRVDARLGGHIVQGHVDAVGKFISREDHEGHVMMKFLAPAEFDRYLIDKGSIAVNGISLTVVRPIEGAFDVWVVPHTLMNTALGTLQPGDPVNLEFDVIAKHVEKLMQCGVKQA